MFQELLNLPKQAIFTLINEKDKKVYISYSTRLHSKLGSIAASLRDNTWRWKVMVKDKKKLQLVVLETTVERNFVKYYKEHYKALGYEIYNETEKPSLWYEFKITYSQRKVLVVAVTTRNDKTTLGRFNTYEEARGFLLYIRHSNPANSLCYAINGVRL